MVVSDPSFDREIIGSVILTVYIYIHIYIYIYIYIYIQREIDRSGYSHAIDPAKAAQY